MFDSFFKSRKHEINGSSGLLDAEKTGMSLSLEIEKKAAYDANEAKLEHGKRWVFSATFINYAMAHWTRKSYTNVKDKLVHAGISPLTIASMDAGFMFTYAGGSFITGMLGDRFSPVAIIAGGLAGSTLCLLLIAFGAITDGIIKNVAVCSTYFITCQLLHGAFQATGGPVNTAIMGNWWPAKGRGLVFGLWTCHQYVGDIVSGIAAAALISNGVSYLYVLIIPAVVNGIWAIINFTAVFSTPEEAGIETESSRAAAAAKKAGKAEVVKSSIGFLQAFMLPNVINYATAFGFFKLVNYAFFFQLPTILKASTLDENAANIISSFYSVGMMPGGVVCGWVSDLYGGRRACVIATFMTILVPILVLFGFVSVSNMNCVVLVILLISIGCLVGGPNNIITSAVAADLADDPSIKGSSKALGTVTGIINGSGSVVAAFGQLIIPVLYDMGKQKLKEGELPDPNVVEYRYVWFFLVFCTAVGTLLMSPTIYKELKPPATEGTPLLPTTRQGGATYQAVPTGK